MTRRRKQKVDMTTQPAPNLVFKQMDVVRQSAAITQNQWYDAWDGSAVAAGAGSAKTNVELQSLQFDQATANEDIEVRIIADDLDETVTQTAVAGTNYIIVRNGNPDTTTYFDPVTTDYQLYQAFVLRARKLQIMYRKTTATGANNTTIKILYAQIP